MSAVSMVTMLNEFIHDEFLHMLFLIYLLRDLRDIAVVVVVVLSSTSICEDTYRKV